MESLDSKKYMLLQKGGKHEVNKVIDHIKYILHNYGKLDKDYIKKHNEVIDLFNAFKAASKIIDEKAEKEKEILDKLVKILKKTKKNRIVNSHKRRQLNTIQKNIMNEYRFLKNSLKSINIDIDKYITDIEMNKTFRKIDINKIKKIHVKNYTKKNSKGQNISVKSHNRIIL